jgi:hypothetical protein
MAGTTSPPLANSALGYVLTFALGANIGYLAALIVYDRQIQPMKHGLRLVDSQGRLANPVKKFGPGDRVYELHTSFPTGQEYRETRSLNVATRLGNAMAKKGHRSVLLQIDYGSHPRKIATFEPIKRFPR